MSIKILKYWHTIEFLQPYNLDDALGDSNPYILFPGQICDQNLPWMNPYALELAGGKSEKNYRYELYLCLFDKSELTRVAKKMLTLPQTSQEHIDWEERLDQEGSTCFAKLTLSPRGSVNLDNLSLSTLPWALGKLESGCEEQISESNYIDETEFLQEYNRKIPLLEVDQDNILDANALMYLCQGLFNWAQRCPTNQPLLAIQLKEVPLTLYEAKLPTLLEDHVKTKDPISNRDYRILNSFYIRDIERVLRKGYKNTNLEPYLSKKWGKRIVLDSSMGGNQILHTLNPKHALKGRWPSPVNHQLNLMQHYSLQEIFSYLKEGGLFSINGPPGTGKTTLVREIIAENMIKRGRALANLSDPQEAFIGTEQLSFRNNKQATISYLHPSLTGYEMVIASSNNTAVENISKELPRSNCVSGSISYLKSVANKIAASHDSKGNVIPLKSEHHCWGLVSVALGKLANCNAFLEKIFFLKGGNNPSYQTIWEWSRNYQGPSFNQAKELFNTALDNVNQWHTDLADFSELHDWIPNTTMDQYCKEQLAVFDKKSFNLKSVQEKVLSSKNFEESKKKSLHLLEKEMESHQALQPSIFKFRSWITHKKQSTTLHTQRLKIIGAIKRVQEDIICLEKDECECKEQLKAADHSLTDKQFEYEYLQKHYHQLSYQFKNINTPLNPLSLTQKKIHHQYFWQSTEHNQRRSKLFSASMALHEAWLADVMKKGHGFGGNLIAISHLLSGSSPSFETSSVHIWQSLFMLVPVVSSTFASFSRLFKDLDASMLGWLIIDEAGQAVPQAAVGAIWRSKRVVAMGDPQQIEPITTIPPNIMDKLGKKIIGNDYINWTPSVTSVQKIADKCNPFGLYEYLHTEKQWIGCPLREHRRCLNPMFSIANFIAYNNKMVHHLQEDKPELSESCWYHICGKTTKKQYVSTQGEFILKQIIQYYEKEKKLPQFYIISPFKKIKQSIISLINKHPFPKTISKNEVRHWAKSRIGTIHSFQGKEEDVVFLVLGADDSTPGAVNWASQKPNLLNVAVTRAKKRLYIVGDINIWGTKPYFQTAAKNLPTVSIDT